MGHSFIHITHAQTFQLWLRKKIWSHKRYCRDARSVSFLNRICIKSDFFSMQLLQGLKRLHLISREVTCRMLYQLAQQVSTEDEMKYKWLVNTTTTLYHYLFCKARINYSDCKSWNSLSHYLKTTRTWDEVKREIQFVSWKQDRQHQCSSRHGPFICVSCRQFFLYLLRQPPLFYLAASD